jgi:Protein of unknown function (DUF1572)
MTGGRSLRGPVLAVSKRYDESAMDPIAPHFLDEIGRQFRGYKRMGEGAIAQVTDDELFAVLDPESNSIAIIVKHLAGNMRSRFTDFLTSDGEKPERHRDQEFELAPGTTRDELMRWWEQGWACLFAALASLKPDDVMRTVYIREEPHTVLQALQRQIAHYAFHIGQIVFLAKHLRSSEWKTLSVPRGQSEEFNRKMIERRRSGNAPAREGPGQKP